MNFTDTAKKINTSLVWINIFYVYFGLKVKGLVCKVELRLKTHEGAQSTVWALCMNISEFSKGDNYEQSNAKLNRSSTQLSWPLGSQTWEVWTQSWSGSCWLPASHQVHTSDVSWFLVSSLTLRGQPVLTPRSPQLQHPGPGPRAPQAAHQRHRHQWGGGGLHVQGDGKLWRQRKN